MPTRNDEGKDLRPPRHHSMTRLLDAAVKVIRAKGYAASTIDEICAVADVTKGSFFHHFKGKEDLAVAAAEYWEEVTSALFDAAPYHSHDDPLDRVLGYVAYRKSIIQGSAGDYSCLLGTMVQEVYHTHPAIRSASERSLDKHVAGVEADIAAAMKVHGVTGPWTPSGLALHTQAVLQGAFVLAKAKGQRAVATDSVSHLECYIGLLFKQAAAEGTKRPAHPRRKHD